jgi:DUF4097 and DUF4098 domain-containing protein YvlB
MRRNITLGIGLALFAAGVLVVLSPSSGVFATLFTTWWPILPIAAGAGSLVGFALRRQPRGPFWGALLMLGGGIALAITLGLAASPLALYGRFWPVLVGVIALVEVLKHYTYRPELGERPRLFSAGKLVLVGAVVVSGLAANRLADAEPGLLARVEMPSALDRLRDQLFGEEFTFDAVTHAAPLPDGGAVSIDNRFGEVTVEGGDLDRVEVTLVPRIRAYDRAEAARAAESLRLVVEPSGSDLLVRTNREEIEHEIATDLRVRVPRGAALRISQEHGAVTVAGLSAAAGLRIDASKSPISIRNVASPIEVENALGTVRVEQSSGSLDLRGRSNNVTIKGFEGAIRLEDSDSVLLSDVRSTAIDLVSVDHASVSMENVTGPSARVSIEGTHTSVKLKKIDGDVRIKTTHDSVRATDVTGLLEVEADHTDVDVARVGSLKVRTSYDAVRAREVAGAVEILADHGDVTVSEFGGSCTVRTTYDDVRLVASAGQAGDVLVENEHGKVDVRLPVGGRYAFDTEVERGEVKIDPAFQRMVSAGAGATRVVLKTSHDDIVVRPGAARSEDDPA